MKIKLNLDTLVVDSFDTGKAASLGRGTVRPHESVTSPEEPDTIAASCGCQSAQGTCAGGTTCAGGATCAWTCGCPVTSVGCTGGGTCGEFTCVESCYPCEPH